MSAPTRVTWPVPWKPNPKSSSPYSSKRKLSASWILTAISQPPSGPTIAPSANTPPQSSAAGWKGTPETVPTKRCDPRFRAAQATCAEGSTFSRIWLAKTRPAAQSVLTCFFSCSKWFDPRQTLSPQSRRTLAPLWRRACTHFLLRQPLCIPKFRFRFLHQYQRLTVQLRGNEYEQEHWR